MKKAFPFRRACLALAIAHTLGADPSRAATLTVTSTTDDGSGCTLREAVVSINDQSLAGGCVNTGSGFGLDDGIVFASSLTGLTIGLTVSDIEVSRDMAITGPGRDQLTLSTGGDFRVFTIDSANVSISSLALTGNTCICSGGAIRIRYASLALDDVLINQNREETFYGGGVLCDDSYLTLNNTTVTSNSAGSGGGGIGAFGCVVTIENSVISNNSARYAGGLILAFGTIAGILDSTISDNRADDYAGGIKTGPNGTVRIFDSTISGNTAVTEYGGGIFSRDDYVKLSGSTLSNNLAVSGGGIHTYDGAMLVVENSTISANTADAFGGGAYVLDGASAQVSSTTITRNEAAGGGGILVSNAATELTNSLVSGNTATVAADELYGFNSTLTASGSNLFGDNAKTSYEAFKNTVFAEPPGSMLIIATSNGTLPTPPGTILLPLRNNGGPTFTHALPDGSPAIDAGQLAGCPATDQRGRPRSDGRCDIGSYEAAGPLCVAISPPTALLFCL